MINIRKSKNPPKGYHRIKVHLVFAVKFDGRHKARLVADGHPTPEPTENIYSGEVSLRNLRLVIFLGKLNNLELWGADIGNAYLEALTDEKLYIVAGPEFQELEGYILIFLNDTIPTKNGRELMEKWVSELKDKFLGPNWQRMLSCAYTTQLLHSTGEVCWNNRDSYFIWFEFVC